MNLFKKESFEKLFVIAGFLIFILLINRGFSAVEIHNSHIHLAALAGIYAVGLASLLLLILKRSSLLEIKNIIRKNILIILFFILLYLSAFWSTNYIITLEKALIMTSMLFFAVYFALRFSYKEHLSLMISTYLIFIIINFLLIFLFPNLGISGEFPGAWEGIFNHKNPLGKSSALGVLLMVFGFIEEKRALKKSFILIILSLLVILTIKSQSITAIASIILIALIALAGFILKKVSRKVKITAILILTALLLIASIIFILSYHSILGSLGKDSTLTGRTEIWNYLLTSTNGYFLKGHGFGGFWIMQDGPSAKINLLLYDSIFHGHNGFLDTFIDLGAIGLGLLILIIINASYLSIRLALKQRNFQALFPICFIIFLIFYNLTDSLFFRLQSGPFLIFFFYILIMLTKMSDKITSTNSKKAFNQSIQSFK